MHNASRAPFRTTSSCIARTTTNPNRAARDERIIADIDDDRLVRTELVEESDAIQASANAAEHPPVGLLAVGLGMYLFVAHGE